MIPGFTVGGVRIRFSLLFPAMLVVLCTQQTGQTAALCLLAAVMHECGHLAALCCVRNRPKEIRFSAFGMCLLLSETPMQRRQQILVALGGPAINLLTAGLLTPIVGMTDTVGVHLMLGVMNLLPVWPLDGGQCLPETRTAKAIMYATLTLLTALGIWLTVLGNVSLLVVAGYLWFRNLTGK